jgi:hypothetical protein
MDKQERMLALMREILQDEYVELSVRSYQTFESLDEGTCRVSATLTNGDGSDFQVESEGVGTIDAFFNALKSRFARDFTSLNSIKFSEFNIRGILSSDDTAKGSQAEAEATLGILNSEGQEFKFRAKSSSISRAGIQATLSAAAYFVNSEKTYVKLHDIIEHYRNSGRMDLVEKYTEIMTRVVENTSYSEVVESLKNAHK